MSAIPLSALRTRLSQMSQSLSFSSYFGDRRIAQTNEASPDKVAAKLINNGASIMIMARVLSAPLFPVCLK